MTPIEAIADVRRVLGSFIWRSISEDDLQRQLAEILDTAGSARPRETRIEVVREHVIKVGRLDLMLRIGGVRLAVEVKISGSPGDVERQAQRYALSDEVDAVIVATTRRVLAGRIAGSDTLGGKPFGVVILRTM